MDYYGRKHMNILAGVAYILSFLCFFLSSGFGYVSGFTGSKPATVVVVNLLAFGLVIGATAAGRSTYKFSAIACAMLLFTPVLAQSKFNWFQTIFGWRMETTAPPVIIAGAALLVLGVFIFEGFSSQLDKKLTQLDKSGAEKEDLKHILEKHLTGARYIGLSFSAFTVIALIFAFILLPSLKTGLGSTFFLLTGAIVAAVSLAFYLFAVGKK